jgi:cellulose synthase operon protein C
MTMRVNPAVTPVPATLPWTDRGEEASATRAGASPRSDRDVEILRSMSRRINPHDAGAHNNLGVVYYNKGMFAEAVELFELALDIDPRMQVAERNLQIAYFGTGYYAQLVTELRARLAEDPADLAARDRLARAYYHAGDDTATTEELQQILERGGASVAVFQRIARVRSRRGDVDGALDALRGAAELEPENARVQLQIGEAHFHRGRSGDAREPLERAVRIEPSLAEALHLLAFVYGDLGDEERARRAAEKAAQLNPSLAKVETSLSLDGYSAARYEELVGERSVAPTVAEGGTLAHYNLGLALRQKALFEEALHEFRLALKHGEDEYLVLQAQAEMLLLRGDGTEAGELYRTLLDQEPASPKLWNELGVAHHQSGDLDSARNAYQRALEIDERYSLAWNNLAIAQHHGGDSPAAGKSLEAALSQQRAVAEIARNLGLLLHRTGQLERAVDAYRRALEADPRCSQAWTGLGIVLLEAAQPEAAKTALLRAVDVDPDAAEARYQLAFALSALGDYQGALRETKLALMKNPYIAAPRFRLLIDLQFEETSVLAPELDIEERVRAGESVENFEFEAGALDAVFGIADPLVAAEAVAPTTATRAGEADQWLDAAGEALARGQLDTASAAIQRAFASGAPHALAYLLQGEILLRRGFSGEAVERFEAVLREIAATSGVADTDDTLRRALHGAARSLLELGRLAEAVEAAERLCALAPDDVDALRTLADALSRAGDHARAVIVLEEARTRAPDHVSLLTQIGLECLATGDPDGAETALRRALALDGDAVAARAALARVLVESGRSDEAAGEYARALAILPSYGEAALGLAELEAGRDRLHAAVNVLVDLLSVDSYLVAAIVRLGDLLLAAGSEADAVIAYGRAVRLDPAHEAALAALERLEPAAVKAAGG